MAGYDFDQFDHYQILNVGRGASLNEIKKAFRQEIASYHPDRYIRANEAERDYARARSQRINEAFRVLRDSKLRENYDNTMQPGRITSRYQRTGRNGEPIPTTPLNPRDHQSELYKTAVEHIEAGRLLQAVAVLRRLQQINPFYKDVATLLTSTELSINARQMTLPMESIRRSSWLTVSIVALVIALIGVGWLLSERLEITGSNLAPTLTPTSIVETTATAIITRTPRATYTPTPALPTATPDPSVFIDDNFSTANWAEATGETWRTSYEGKRYRIRADQFGDAAWSYRPLPEANVRIVADVQIVQGKAGIVVRYRDDTDFTAVLLAPASQEFIIVQRQGDSLVELARGTHLAIQSSSELDNLIDVRVVGSELTLSVNGSLVTGLEIATMAESARFGMIAVPDMTGADAYFSRFTARIP
ncbi:MAG: J domain-containing protein [Roseiflexaceae bacterium]